jgi:hypothetical protein
MPVMVPGTSERNLTPSSTELSAPPSTKVGTAVVGQMVTVVGVAATVMLSALLVVAAGLAESLTCTVKLDVAAAVGVPVIAPVAGFKTRTLGSL